jgi:hypothetical protein
LFFVAWSFLFLYPVTRGDAPKKADMEINFSLTRGNLQPEKFVFSLNSQSYGGDSFSLSLFALLSLLARFFSLAELSDV